MSQPYPGYDPIQAPPGLGDELDDLLGGPPEPPDIGMPGTPAPAFAAAPLVAQPVAPPVGDWTQQAPAAAGPPSVGASPLGQPVAAPTQQFVTPAAPPSVSQPYAQPPVGAPAFAAPTQAAPVVAPMSSAAVPDFDPTGGAGLLGADAPQPLNPVAPLQDAPVGRPEIERLLVGMVLNGGSDMHITHGEIPRYRVHGGLLPIAGEDVLVDEEIERMLEEILTESQWKEFKETNDLDAAYSMLETEGAAITCRFRVNVYRSLDHTGAVFRVIPTKIASLDDLGILPQVKKLATRPRGLILVCGPTGSGKSTTLAGLVDLINTTRTERIFTFEDPVEFTHSSKKCLVNHREIGTDTPTFEEGLRRVRREDPDIILIGEMRDYETIDAAIEAADTGHLVLATLHTNSAPETISRIINSFPSERQDQVRITLSSVLISVICQVLVPSPVSKRGRVVATEIMMVTPGIRNNIRENDIPAIANALSDTSNGSISLDMHLAELIRSNQITKKEALKKATTPAALERYLGGDGGSLI